MKKILRNSLGILLAGSALFATACGEKGDTILPPYSEYGYTDYVLVNNGQSDYSIVISDEADKYEKFAAEELQKLFKEATDATLPIRLDSQVDYSANAKVISIGNNDFQKDSGITVNFDTVQNAGGVIANKDSNLILLGGATRGSVNMTYEFLAKFFDYDFYNHETYEITRTKKFNVPEINETCIPSFDSVWFWTWDCYPAKGGNEAQAWKRRFHYNVDASPEGWGGHSALVIIPFDKYYNKLGKTEWFSTADPRTAQLCYTNEELLQEYIKNIKEYLVRNPGATEVGMGDTDYNDWCHCSSCTEVLASYDLKDANGEIIMKAPNTVTGVRFKSRAAWAIDEWLAEEYPGRHVTYPSHAYFQQRTPPVYITPQGEYIRLTNGEPDDPLMNVNPNIRFEVAAIEANRNESWEDNKSQGEELKKWAQVTTNLVVYDYPQDAANVLVPYDGLHVHADNMRYAHSLGHKGYLFQGNTGTQSGGFYDLRVYVCSKLAWDVNADVNTLVEKYLKACYGPAYEYMKELYTSQRTNMARCREQNNYGGHCLGENMTNQNWPRELLIVHQALIDKAYKSIEYIKFEDPIQYESYFRWIKVEELTIQYINLCLYRSMYSYEEKNALIDEFMFYSNLYDATLYHEAKPMSDKVSEWRRD